MSGGWVAWFARNRVAANLLMFLLVVGGLAALPRIREEVFPEFSSEMVTVAVVYPGAAPEEIEESICVRIEEAVYAIDGVKRVRSVAAEGAGTVTIEVRSGEDTRRVLDDVKTRVDAIDTFPEEAEQPVISEVTMRKQVLNVAVSGPADEVSLKRLAERLRDELSALDGISQVELAAVRDYEVSVEVSERALQRHGLTFQEVADAVRRSSLDLPGGSIKTRAGEVLLRTKGQAYRGREFEELPLMTRPDGTRVLLGEVADIVDGFEETDQLVAFDGQPAALVRVFRTGDQSALDVGATVREYVAAARGRMPEGIELTIWQDDSVFLQERLDTLIRNGRSGLLLVFLVLALFLRLRLAFWVTLGIPVSFLGTLMLMPYLDVSLNMLSLFAFILVLGIVVDDAIVVGENVYRKQREGLRGVDAAIEGARGVAVPVTFAVLTTIAAFLPMLGLPGTTGRIWRIIPLIVIPALLFSLVESKLVLPAHLAHEGRDWSRTGGWVGLWTRVQGAFANSLETLAERVFKPSLDAALRWRYVTLATSSAVLVAVVALVLGGRVRRSFFPPVPGDNVVALLTMPQGTPATVTAESLASIESAAEDLIAELEAVRPPEAPPVVVHRMSTVGEQPFRTVQSRNGGRQGSEFVGAHLAEVNLQLSSSEVRDVSSAEIERMWRERVGEIPDVVELTFTSSLFSAGASIDIQLSSPDEERLRGAAARLKAAVAGYPGAYNVADSFRAGKKEIELRIRPEAEALGVSLADLGRQVRQAFYGEEAQRIVRGRDDVKVMVRYPADERRSLATLEALRVRLPDGTEVPFGSVAEASFGRGFASIVRTDRRRTINVTADVDPAAGNANEILKALSEPEGGALAALSVEFPGVRWDYEGEQQEQRETLSGLGRGFVLALFVIYALMAIPFRSYLQPLIIMAAIPFGLVGAVLGHMLLDLELSILSMCGMVALAGVVVNDSLVLVDFANQAVRDGVPVGEAVRRAGVARFRPILLTSMTTFAGLTPMLLERSVQAKFLIPMAVSLAFGVLFSTAISLVIVPAGTLVLEDLRALPRRLLRGSGRRGEPPLEVAGDPL